MNKSDNMNLLDTKAGKRVRGSMVSLLKDAIDSLRAIMVWAEYADQQEIVATDDLESGEKRETGLPIATLGDIERSRALRRPRARGSGRVGGTPNWSAKVGQIIIGNLMRGEGGRFASARNIAKMMNLLDDVGITPDMFTGMQALLAGTGQTLSGSVMADLRAAGLINDQGVVQGKANEIINAIKTGQPDNLKKVLKPPSGGGGSSASGPSTEEKQAANVEKLMGDVVASTKLTEGLITALIEFFDGEDIDEADISALVDLGLLAYDADNNIFMTSYGRSIVTNMRQGDLRDVLDAYSRAINSMADGTDTSESDAEKEKNVASVTEAFVERGEMTEDQIDRMFAFDKGDDLENTQLADLIDLGLLNITQDGVVYMTTRGQQLITRFERGDIRDALDALSQSRQEEQSRREARKETRASGAERLISDGSLERSQADALIRTWVRQTEEIDAAAVAELNSMGLMSGNSLSAYGILLMKLLDNGALSIARQMIAEASGKAFYGIKQLGSSYFLTWTTNAFKDRDQEIFSTDAIEDYLSYGDSKGSDSLGVYDWWHIEGSEFADIVWQGGVGRFMIEIGRYHDTPIGNSFKAFFEKYPMQHDTLAPHGWGCSHQFRYIPEDRKDNVFEWFHKDKSTIMPLQEASNPFTLSEFGLGAKSMDLTAKQKASLETIAEEIGMPDLFDRIESAGRQRTELLEKSGFEFKAKKVCKTEDGVCYPAADYAFVPDAQQPSAWKLRMTQGKPGNVTVEQLGRAAAAFSEGGFRGNQVELPSGTVSSVKRKIRGQYRKLDVPAEDIPESIKMLKDDIMNRSQIAKKMVDLAALVPEEDKAQLGEAAVTIAEPDSDVAAIQRMLMELLTDLPDDTRAQAEELVTALGELAMPLEVLPVEEIAIEEELPIEEPLEGEPLEGELPIEEEQLVEEEELATDEAAMDEEEDEEDEVIVDREGEMKALADTLVKSLHLEELSTMLEMQAASVKGFAAAIDELTLKFKGLRDDLDDVSERIGKTDDLEEQVKQVKKDVSGVKEQTDAVLAEKQRWVPFWANGVGNASVARTNELSTDEQKDYRKPEVPNVIAGIRNRMLHQD